MIPDDLEKAVRFYRDGLGLPTEGIIGTEFEYGAVAFFDLLASGGVLGDKQTFQEVTVVHLETGQESAVNLSVKL